MNDQGRSRLGTAVVVVLSIAMLAPALAFTWLRATLPSEAAIISADAWSWTADGVAVAPIGDAGPFAAGDRVSAFGGRSIESWANAAVRPGGTPTTNPVPQALGFDITRGDAPVHLDAELAVRPIWGLLVAGLALLAYTLVQAVVALLVWLRHPAESWRRGFLVGSVGNVASAVVWQLGLRPTDLARPEPMLLLFTLTAAFHLVFWSSVVHVIGAYPWRPGEPMRRGRVAALYGLPQVALLAGIAATGLTAGSTSAWIGSWERTLSVIVLVMIVLVLVALAQSYRRTPAGQSTQVRIVIAACLAGALSVGLLTVLPILLVGSPLATRSAVASIGLPLAVLLVIGTLRNNLFEMDLLIASRRRLIVAREEERRRIRRDLHDGMGPMLAAMTLKVDLARDVIRSDPEAADAALVALRADTQAAVAEIRRLTRELRPPALDELGVVDAIRHRAVELSGGPEGERVEITVDADGAFEGIDAAVEAAAYRIAVEAMTNVIRHAHARRCRVRIGGNGVLVVEVSDDGVGFAAGRGAGVGMMSMRERCAELGGALEVTRTVDGWTVVRATLPVA